MVFAMTSTFLPLQALDRNSLFNFDHVFSISSLSNQASSAAQIGNLESIITFPGFRRAIQYYFNNSGTLGVPSTMFGPILIQRQPGNTLAAMLYIERLPNDGIGYSIQFRRIIEEFGQLVFSEEVVKQVHFAQKEHLKTYFNRVHPVSAVVSSLIALANGIYSIDHGRDASVIHSLQQTVDFKYPGEFMVAPYRRDVTGHFFGIEDLEEYQKFGGISGLWKEDFFDLLINFRKYIPFLLENGSASDLAPEHSYFINKSLGPIRIKFLNEEKALGLFVHLRPNSIRSFEFWIGEIPYQGDAANPRFDYNKISIIKRELTSVDFSGYFPTLDSLDLMLPLFLQAIEMLPACSTPYKEMQEIIDDCKKNFPRETNCALGTLAKQQNCPIHEVLHKVDEEDIKESLHQSIYVGREFKKILQRMESYKHFGNKEDVVVSGSQKEIELIRKERARSAQTTKDTAKRQLRRIYV